MLWAASTVCFFGFMRAGKLMMTLKKGFDPLQHLALNDVACSHRQPETIVNGANHLEKLKDRHLSQGSRHRSGNYRR